MDDEDHGQHEQVSVEDSHDEVVSLQEKAHLKAQSGKCVGENDGQEQVWTVEEHVFQCHQEVFK